MTCSLRRAIAGKPVAASFALGGILVFAWFIHGNPVQFAIALSGLLLAAAMISFSAKDLPALLTCLGLDSFNVKTAGYSLVGLGLGILLALVCRVLSNLGPFPATLTGIAWVVPLVGITEELFFRGFVQGTLSTRGNIAAVVVPALGHTLYKYLVLRSLPDPTGFDFPVLLVLTFAGGITFGLLRTLSKSIIPAAAAHGIFDVLVYGGLSTWPAWVWG
jgi:membrane protease YdiL (CAAX protease family)